MNIYLYTFLLFILTQRGGFLLFTNKLNCFHIIFWNHFKITLFMAAL